MGSRRMKGTRPIPQTEAGYSQLHWSRLISKEDDLTEGVGVADPDDADCPTWTMAEVRRHNTRDDAWMVLRGRVFNVTRYLRYHPGSVEEIMRAAGDDATVLYDEIHPWVSADILEPCCVGKLAKGGAKGRGGASSAGGKVGAAGGSGATAPRAGLCCWAGASQSATEGDAPLAPPASTPIERLPGALDEDSFCRLKLVSRQAVARDSALLRFALPTAESALGVLVGEHVQLSRTGQPKHPTRAFTPVGVVHATGALELLVRRVGDGSGFSGWLCALQPGDFAFVRGPRGAGVYGAWGAAAVRLPGMRRARRSDAPLRVARVLLVTAGSGIAPALAMLRTLEAAGSDGALSVTHIHASPSALHVGGLAELLRLSGALGHSLRLRLALSTAELAPIAAGGGGSKGPDILAEGAEVDAITAAARQLLAHRSDGHAGASGGADVQVRVERLSEGLFEQWAPAPGPDVCVLCCGPPGFNRDVAAWAAAAGFEEGSVHLF